MKTEEELFTDAQEWAKKEKENRLFGQQVSRCVDTEEYQRDAYIAGYEACKEYIMGKFILISNYEFSNYISKKSLRTK